DVPAEIVISAARRDEHGDASVFVFGRCVYGERRLGDVGEPFGRLAVNLIRLAFDHELEEFFLAGKTEVVGGFAGPETDNGGLSERWSCDTECRNDHDESPH